MPPPASGLISRWAPDGRLPAALLVPRARYKQYRVTGGIAQNFHWRMTMQKIPYGMAENVKMRCVNAEPGTYGHECSKPATWIGTKANGFHACYCSSCKEHGYEARDVVTWKRAT